MATRPDSHLNWTTDGAPSKVAAPPAAQRLIGWVAGEPIPAQWLNWLSYQQDRWNKYFDDLLAGGSASSGSAGGGGSATNARLLNGGSWTFNSTTGVLSWSAAFNIGIPSIPDSANQVAAGSVTLTDGQVAYVAVNQPYLTTADVASGSNQLSNVAFPQNIAAGQSVTGTGIPAGATVVTVSGTTVTISANATATNVGAQLVFAATSALTPQVADNSALRPASNTMVFARRTGPTVQVGVNAAETHFRNGESKYLRGSGGFASTLWVTAGETLAVGQVVYISAGAAAGDTGRTAGRAYLADASIPNAAMRSSVAGFVYEAATVGNNVGIVASGSLLLPSASLTTGSVYFLSTTTPGAYTTTRPINRGEAVRPIAVATSSTSLSVHGHPVSGTLATYEARSVAELIAALASCAAAGGGRVVLSAPVTLTSAVNVGGSTILESACGPQNTLTIGAGGSLNLTATYAEARDLYLTCTQASSSVQNLMTVSGNACTVRGCRFTMAPSDGGSSVYPVAGIYVTGSSARIDRCAFSGVQGAAYVAGIAFAAGTDNIDSNCVFA